MPPIGRQTDDRQSVVFSGRAGTGKRCRRGAKEIIEETQHRKVDLIAMGTRGLSPLRGLLLGSVAAEVASRSPIPIWLMGPNAAIPAALGRVLRLLVAIDGSKQAAHAANRAGRMAPYLG